MPQGRDFITELPPRRAPQPRPAFLILSLQLSIRREKGHLGPVSGLTVDIKARWLTERGGESLELSGDGWEAVSSLGLRTHTTW